MDRVLVTGATGFTGFHLCKRLRSEGESVIAFVRSTSQTDPLVEIGVECRVVDLTSAKDVLNNFGGIKKVFHLAAAFREEFGERNYYYKVHVETTRNLLEAAEQKGVTHFVHCSTVGVQGDIEDPPAKEDYRYKPGDLYQETKMQGELVAKEFIQKGLPVTIVRPVGIYGPGEKRFLKLFRPISRHRFVMIGSGKVKYHLTYIDDLIDGILLCGSKSEAIGEIFTIGGNQFTTLRELVNLIADVEGKPHPQGFIPYWPVYLASVLCERLCFLLRIRPPLYPRRVEFFIKDRAFDISKAKRLLGYEPQYDLRAGLAKTAQWYEEQGLI